jgi:hypothetical protein
MALLYSEANRNKIEQIQERALRFIYNDYKAIFVSIDFLPIARA